jgi:hypothetical protein
MGTGLKRKAHRRYVFRIFISMLCYMATLFLAVRLVGHDHVTGPLAWVLALLPGLSVAGVFWAVGKLLVEEDDEYQRMLLVRQTLVATAFTLTVVTIYGFLENFGLVGHVDAFYVSMLWFVGLGVGTVANRLTVGAWGGI